MDPAAAALEDGDTEAAATATAVELASTAVDAEEVTCDDATAVVRVVEAAASEVCTAAEAEVAATDDEAAVAVATATEAVVSESDEPEQLKTEGPGTG